MHSCPICEAACHCSGDMEDHDTGDEFLDDCMHECYDPDELEGADVDD